MDINEPKLFLNSLQKFLEKRSVFHQFVTDSCIVPFTHGHSAITAYNEGAQEEMAGFESMCKQFVDKFDQHIRSALLVQAPPCPTRPTWGGARCVGGPDGLADLEKHLSLMGSYPSFSAYPETFVLDQFAIRRNEAGWVIPNPFALTSTGKKIHPDYRAARYESRFWIKPYAIMGRNRVEDFACIQWSQGRFHIQYQFGYDIDCDEVRQDCIDRMPSLTADKSAV